MYYITTKVKIALGIITILLVALVSVFVIWKWTNIGRPPLLGQGFFVCDGDKTIDAKFYADRVSVVMSDGRKMTLSQTVSASGARYAAADEAVVFWNKGDTAFVTEGVPSVQTFFNCEIVKSGEEPHTTYASTTLGVSVRYPRSFALNAAYRYEQFGEKKLINGFKFIIPLSVATGTNLSSFDTGVSVETLPRAKNCTADIFIPDDVRALSIVEDGVMYSVATTTGAAAGNRYEEMVYAFSSSTPCIAVRYLIHTTAIENYEPGSVRSFDRSSVLQVFDSIRRSIVLRQIP